MIRKFDEKIFNFSSHHQNYTARKTLTLASLPTETRSCLSNKRCLRRVTNKAWKAPRNFPAGQIDSEGSEDYPVVGITIFKL